MAAVSRGRAAVKFAFWTIAAASLIFVVVRSYTSGQMAAWYYHTASMDGYAVNAGAFMDATKERPAVLQVVQTDRIEGLQAVPVSKGGRLPANANGVIATTVLQEGKRASLEDGTLIVTVPWKIAESKGFKYKDTFKHKGIKTYPWAAVWNVAMVLGIGLCLGYMAEGFTDFIGLKLEKIKHFEGH